MATEEASVATSAGGEREVMELDIDGVPLRDHRAKVDLKAILGHAPEVDDDEEEAPPEVEIECQVAPLLEASASDLEETAGDEDADCLNCVVQRQRRSSLRAQHIEPPDSPSAERKAVRFADSLGIGLEAIRDLADSDEPPEIPHSAMTALRLRRRRPLNSRLVLAPVYPQPTIDDAFLASLDRHHVLLESSFVSSRELTVSGVVRVTHGSVEKAVTVRYSTDSWVTHRDVPANYVPNSNDGTTDRFVFIIHLPEGFGEEGSCPDRQERLEFAVALHAGSDTFWDNNDGGNYVIDCVMRSRESSVSGEPKTPDDFESVEGQTPDGDDQ